MIRQGAAEAAVKLASDPGSFRYLKLNPPYVRTARFRKHQDNPPYSARDEHPGSVIALMNMPFTPAKPAP